MVWGGGGGGVHWANRCQDGEDGNSNLCENNLVDDQ